MSDVIVLGHDHIGTVATCDGLTYYLTECCGATAKGLDGYVGCRSCYQPIDLALGDVPDKELRWHPEREGADRIEFVPRRIEWVKTYGDGLPYDLWKRLRAEDPEKLRA